MLKKFFILSGMFLMLFATSIFAIEKEINIGKNSVMQLSGGNVEIVVDAKASNASRFAANELKKFLDLTLKGNADIVEAPTQGRNHFFIGMEFASKAGIDAGKLFRDAFYIVNRSDGIYIGGIDSDKANPEKQLHLTIWSQYYERATLFGVYDWLERFANVRFYFPGELGTIIQPKDKIDVPEASIFDFPDFNVRRHSMYQGKWMDTPKSPEALERYNKYRVKTKFTPYRTITGDKLVQKKDDYRNEEKNLVFYRNRMETFMEPNCHGLARLSYVERFGKEHPEYFALKDNGERHVSGRHYGSICYSSNIVEEIYQDVKSFLSGEKADVRGVLSVHTGKPGWDPSACQKGFINIMPQDSYYRCRCEKCKPRFGTGVNYATEMMWQFTADIANRLKREGIPGTVTQMAYRPYRSVPQTVDIPDNVSVMVAEIGPWGQYNPAAQKRDYDEIAAWSRKIAPRRVYLWNYCGKYGPANLPDIPNPSHKALALYFKTLKPLNIRGAFIESESDRYINNYLLYYIFGKYAWNNNADTDALIAEHHKLMFAEAADIMASIFDDMERLWLSKVVVKQVDTEVGPLISVPTDSELWGNVYSEDFIKSLQKRFGDAEKLTAGNRLANERVKLFRREWLEPLAAARVKYYELTDVAGQFSLTLNEPIHLRPFHTHGKPEPTFEKVDTKVTVSIGNESLRVVFECEEPDYDKIIASERPLNDRNVWQDSSVEFFISPDGDNYNYYQFIINARNSKTGNIRQLNGNQAKNMGQVVNGFYSNVTRSKNGFRAAMSIPLKQLKGFDINKAKLNFARNRILRDKNNYITLYTWNPFIRRFNEIEKFGKISEKKEAPRTYVANGDFTAPKKDRWLGKWFHEPKLKDGVSIERDTNEYFSWPASMKITSSGNSPAFITQYLPELEQNCEYEVRCLIKYEDVKLAPKSTTGGIKLNINVESNDWYPKTGMQGSGNWTQLKYRFKTTDKTNNPHRAYMRIYILGATGCFNVDDVVITKVEQ